MFVIIFLSSTVAEFDEEMKDNNIKSTTHLYHTYKDKFCISKAVSLKLSNPLSKICQICYDKKYKKTTILYLKNNIPLQSIELEKV